MSGGLECSVGCTHHFFKAQGTLVSEGGGPLGTWRSTPLGCSRDPVDGPVGVHAETVATLLWDDMMSRDQYPRRGKHLKNLPARLDLWKTDAGFAGKLETLKPTVSMALNGGVCGTFDVTANEGKPVIEHGRPTLDGTVTLDCNAAGNHVSGRIEFSGCEY